MGMQAGRQSSEHNTRPPSYHSLRDALINGRNQREHRPAVNWGMVGRWGTRVFPDVGFPPKHWRRQLWALGHVPYLDFQQFNFFQLTLELHKLQQSLVRLPVQNIFVSCNSSGDSSVAAT